MRWIIFTMVFLFVINIAIAFQTSSANYQSNITIIDAGGTEASSANYKLKTSIGNAVVGNTSSANYRSNLRFFREIIAIPPIITPPLGQGGAEAGADVFAAEQRALDSINREECLKQGNIWYEDNCYDCDTLVNVSGVIKCVKCSEDMVWEDGKCKAKLLDTVLDFKRGESLLPLLVVICLIGLIYGNEKRKKKKIKKKKEDEEKNKKRLIKEDEEEEKRKKEEIEKKRIENEKKLIEEKSKNAKRNPNIR